MKLTLMFFSSFQSTSLSSCVFSNVYSLRLQLFLWKQLENLYFREKKFAVEVNDPHRSEEETTSPI